MGKDNAQSRRRSPVTEHARFDVGQFGRLFQQLIIIMINMVNREIVGSSPVSVYLSEPL